MNYPCYIKLHNALKDGRVIWLNVDHIIAIQPCDEHDNKYYGSYSMVLVTGELSYDVVETVDEVFKLMGEAANNILVVLGNV